VSRLTTHVLDATTGRPAAGLAVRLERVGVRGPALLAAARTGEDGRIGGGLGGELPAGRYRLVFATGAWLAAAGRETLFPEVVVTLDVDGDSHLHVPLLLAPHAYTTYRGS
jgi:5-hydroxyisourate hydrolase